MPKLDYIQSIVKEVEPDWDFDGLKVAEFIDSGSYALNALCSGSCYKGIPDRSTMFAGAESTGKTYFILGLVQKFLQDHEEGACIFVDAEESLEKNMLKTRAIPEEQLIYINTIDTIEEYREKMCGILDRYNATPDKQRQPLILVLDSLGNLPSHKENTDMGMNKDGNYTSDMTKSKAVRSVFRTVRPRAGRNGVPLLIANHTYKQMDQYKPDEISGGGGAKYASSTTVVLSKSEDAEGKGADKVVRGSIIKAMLGKSRYAKMFQKVHLRLDFTTGLDRHYGLLPLAEASGIVKKVSTKYEFPDGSSHFEKHINDNPEKYYTKEIMEAVEAQAKIEHGLG
jgi:RecA/RadA recombinase